MAGAFADRFRDEVLAPSSFVGTVCDRRVVQTLFDENRAGRADHGYALWALWMLERWRMKYAASDVTPRQPAGELSAALPIE